MVRSDNLFFTPSELPRPFFAEDGDIAPVGEEFGLNAESPWVERVDASGTVYYQDVGTGEVSTTQSKPAVGVRARLVENLSASDMAATRPPGVDPAEPAGETASTTPSTTPPPPASAGSAACIAHPPTTQLSTRHQPWWGRIVLAVAVAFVSYALVRRRRQNILQVLARR